jgi:D-alanine--poly(phosphoribitol) ligase subunit 1
MQINVLEYLENTVERHPQKTAIADSTSNYSFKQIRAFAWQISIQLDKLGESNKSQPIAVLLPKSAKAVIAFIGVLYSGNIYVPIDTKNPPERIKKIVDNVNPLIAISDSKHEDILLGISQNISIVNLDENWKSGESHTSIPNTLIDTDPAYILHTSGSTGSPKGVVISHRSIIDYTDWAIKTFEIDSKEIIGNQAPFHFDNSTLDIYLMLATGAELVVIPEKHFMFPQDLIKFISSQKINFVFWVPSVLVSVANLRILNQISPKYLKKVLFAGEVMPTKTLNYWIDTLPKDVLFANLYGPTEITVDCTFYIISEKIPDNKPVPIGKACRNSGVLILNEKDNVASKNEIGELCVRGSSLSLGYWRSESTAEVFVQNPLHNNYPELIYRTGDLVRYGHDGDIEYIGRKDNQIKHLGHRIELGEIEHIILSNSNIKKLCVLFDEILQEIVMFYQYNEIISIREFRRMLIGVLPKYMLPGRYELVSNIPSNSSGKIDRLAMKKRMIGKY